MATKAVLADLANAYEARSRHVIVIESVGGVDAARRVQAGEPFDVVVLASDAIDKLLASEHLVAGSKVDLARSSVAVAVPAGARGPTSAARTPSGAPCRRRRQSGPRRPERRRARDAVPALGHRRADPRSDRHAAAGRTRRDADRARRGRPRLSAALGADSRCGHRRAGTVATGDPDRHHLLGRVGARARQPDDARALLAFMASPAATDAKRRQGMEAA